MTSSFIHQKISAMKNVIERIGGKKDEQFPDTFTGYFAKQHGASLPPAEEQQGPLVGIDPENQELVFAHYLTHSGQIKNIAVFGDPGSGRTNIAEQYTAGFLADGGQVVIASAGMPGAWDSFLSSRRQENEKVFGQIKEEFYGSYRPLWDANPEAGLTADAREGVVDVAFTPPAVAHVVRAVREIVERRNAKTEESYRPLLLAGSHWFACFEGERKLDEEVAQQLADDFAYILDHQKGTNVSVLLADPTFEEIPHHRRFVEETNTVIGAGCPLEKMDEFIGAEKKLETSTDSTGASSSSAWIYTRENGRIRSFSPLWFGAEPKPQELLNRYVPFTKKMLIEPVIWDGSNNGVHREKGSLYAGKTPTGENIIFNPWEGPDKGHIVVSGYSGAGKSGFIRGLLADCLYQGITASIISPKKLGAPDYTDFAGNAFTPEGKGREDTWAQNITACATQELEDVVQVLRGLVERVKEGKCSPDSVNPHLVVLDNPVPFAEVDPRWKDPQEDYLREIQESIEFIAEHGLESGVVIVSVIQRPLGWRKQNNFIYKLFKNSSTRVQVGIADPLSARFFFGVESFTEADQRSASPGVGYIRIGAGPIVPFGAVWTGPRERFAQTSRELGVHTPQ